MTKSSSITPQEKRLTFSFPKELDPLRIPEHIAVIMDGNGRWAKAKGLPRAMGHTAGVDALKTTLKLCSNWGVGALTVYAFSTENWSRPGEEVGFLMTLFKRVLKRELESLKLQKVRISFLGDLEKLSSELQDLILEATTLTAKNTGINFNVCTNYGGRRELVKAAQRLALRSVNGEIDPALIDENVFAAELSTANEVDPDLLIRTSGERRISNFLLWQLAYSEIYITETLWPDFDENALIKALLDYQSRCRRFGGLKHVSKDKRNLEI